jgi:hypothetical protein
MKRCVTGVPARVRMSPGSMHRTEPCSASHSSRRAARRRWSDASPGARPVRPSNYCMESRVACSVNVSTPGPPGLAALNALRRLLADSEIWCAFVTRTRVGPSMPRQRRP